MEGPLQHCRPWSDTCPDVSFARTPMREILVVSLFILVFSAFTVHSQSTASRNLTQDREDAFRIEMGSSFAASKGRNPNLRDRGIAAFGASRATSDYLEALNMIRSEYVDGNDLDPDAITSSVIDGMLRTLDPHSNYYGAADYSDLLTEQRSEYFGIGASIANIRIGSRIATFVTSTHKGSPASKGGLRFGDRILFVDGEKIEGDSALYVRDRIRGPVGSPVRITIRRPGSPRPLRLSLKRERIDLPTISDAYLISESVGFIKLSGGFNYTTAEELAASISVLRKNGMRSLILDLRDNPGGILEQSVKVASAFLPYGSTILVQKGRISSENRKWISRNRHPIKIPLILLVNEESASASEIVAGALQDHDRALIVGERTFGKGLVQSVIDLPFGAGLTLTTAKYYTPSGRLIQRDYTNVGRYDYFRHKFSNTTPQPRFKISRTASGRPVRGGDGIRPDMTVAPSGITDFQERLSDPIFLFSRELAAGRILSGDPRLRFMPRVYRKASTVRRSVNDRAIVRAFISYARHRLKIGLHEKTFLSERKFIDRRIRFNMLTAFYGPVMASRAEDQFDPQLRAAVSKMPEARILEGLPAPRR